MRFSLNLVRFGLGLLVLGLSSCATTSPLKVPVRPSPMHTLEDPPPARLRIPVVISLPQLADVEKQMADFFKADWDKVVDQSLTKSLGTTVWWDPLDWKLEDHHLTAQMNVHAKGKETAEAEALEKQMKVQVDSSLEWSRDWRLGAPDFAETNTTNASAPGETDQDKSERLLRKGTSKFHESLRDKTKDVMAKARDLWKEIQQPIRMAEDIWLQIVPDHVSVGNYEVVADLPFPRLQSVFEITAQPKVIIGPRPQPLKGELPPLEDYKPGPEGFHVVTNLKISFKEVNKLLTDPKTGLMKKVMPGGGDHQVKITDLNLYGSGGKLVVEAQVQYNPVLSSKPSQLTIYLVGTPDYHRKAQKIDFPDMDFDIKTSDFLVQMAEFISNSGMREQLREQAVIPVGENLDKLKEQLTKLLNRPIGHYAKLRTTIDSLKMEEVFVSDYGIEGRVAMDGDAHLDVTW